MQVGQISPKQTTDTFFHLDYDPFHLITRLALLNLIATAEKEKKHNLQYRVFIRNSKVCYENTAIHDKWLPISGYFVDSHQHPEELMQFNKHLITALRWIPPGTSEASKTIYEAALPSFDLIIENLQDAFAIRGMKEDKELLETMINGKNIKNIGPTIKELQKESLTNVEKQELEQYKKIMEIWTAKHLQCVSLLIQLKDIETLRIFLRGRYKAYTQTRI